MIQDQATHGTTLPPESVHLWCPGCELEIVLLSDAPCPNCKRCILCGIPKNGISRCACRKLDDPRAVREEFGQHIIPAANLEHERRRQMIRQRIQSANNRILWFGLILLKSCVLIRAVSGKIEDWQLRKQDCV